MSYEINLIEGERGRLHVTSDDARTENALMFGIGRKVFNMDNSFDATMVTGNIVRITSGIFYDNGMFIRIDRDQYVEVSIDTGLAGTYRHDLICIRYERNIQTQLESASIVVKKGETSETKAIDPTYEVGNVLDLETHVDEFPLYRVVLNGISAKLEPMFTVEDMMDNVSLYKEMVEHLQNDNNPAGNKHIPAGGSSGQILCWKADGEAVWGANKHPTIAKENDSTSKASPNAGGTFTAIDSIKRDDNGHVTKVNTKTVTLPKTSVTVDDALSDTSTNPVQNKVVKEALNNKASNISVAQLDDKVTSIKDSLAQSINTVRESLGTHKHDVATQSTNGFMSASDKKKLDGVRKYIFITDSYGSNGSNALNYTGNSWVEFCAGFLNLSTIDYIKRTSPGAGFTVSGNLFITQLQAIVPTLSTSTKESYTDIIVGGGCNDIGQAPATILTAIEAFVDYAKTEFPNATVRIGCIGWYNDAGFDFWEGSKPAWGYSQCAKAGAVYLTNTEYIMHNYDYFGNGHHPNITGSEAIGYHMAQAVKTGSCDVHYLVNPAITYASWVGAATRIILAMGKMSNGVNNLTFVPIDSSGAAYTNVQLNATGATAIVTTPDAAVPLFTVSGGTMLGDNYRRIGCPGKIVVMDGVNAYNVNGRFYLQNGMVAFAMDEVQSNGVPYTINMTHIRIPAITFTADTMIG